MSDTLDDKIELNEKTLKLMKKQGEDLEEPREIEFYAKFDSVDQAESFLNALPEEYENAEILEAEEDDELPMVVFTREVSLDAEAIAEMEMDIQDLAERFGGEYEGWEPDVDLGEDDDE